MPGERKSSKKRSKKGGERKKILMKAHKGFVTKEEASKALAEHKGGFSGLPAGHPMRQRAGQMKSVYSIMDKCLKGQNLKGEPAGPGRHPSPKAKKALEGYRNFAYAMREGAPTKLTAKDVAAMWKRLNDSEKAGWLRG